MVKQSVKAPGPLVLNKITDVQVQNIHVLSRATYYADPDCVYVHVLTTKHHLVQPRTSWEDTKESCISKENFNFVLSFPHWRFIIKDCYILKKILFPWNMSDYDDVVCDSIAYLSCKFMVFYIYGLLCLKFAYFRFQAVLYVVSVLGINELHYSQSLSTSRGAHKKQKPS